MTTLSFGRNATAANERTEVAPVTVRGLREIACRVARPPDTDVDESPPSITRDALGVLGRPGYSRLPARAARPALFAGRVSTIIESPIDNSDWPPLPMTSRAANWRTRLRRSRTDGVRSSSGDWPPRTSCLRPPPTEPKTSFEIWDIRGHFGTFQCRAGKHLSFFVSFCVIL